MPTKRKRSFAEMQKLRKEYRKALEQHQQEAIALSIEKDIDGLKMLGPKPEEPSWYEELSGE